MAFRKFILRNLAYFPPVVNRRILAFFPIVSLVFIVLQSTTRGAPTSTESGQLAGQVTMSGNPVPDKKIQVTKDPKHCRPADMHLVRLGKQGTLADVVIEIRRVKEPPQGWSWPSPPSDGYHLRQQGCSFTPYLQVIPDGAEITVINEDPVAHNVNTGSWNIMQPAGASPMVRTLSGRQPIRVGCNIHSWMEAWIYTAKTPLYAITELDGEYRIKNIPPGNYRVSAWHPYLGLKRFRAKIVANELVTQDLQFDSPE